MKRKKLRDYSAVPWFLAVVFFNFEFARYFWVFLFFDFRVCFNGFFFCFCSSAHRTLVSDRLQNVTQTISRILEGYDIRLRPDFGGKFIAILKF